MQKRSYTGVDYFESFAEHTRPSPQFIRDFKIKYLKATPVLPTTGAGTEAT